MDNAPRAVLGVRAMDRRSQILSMLGVAAALALRPSGATAQVATAPEVPVTARTMALGGGTYGTAVSTSGIFSNPAAMGLARLYHVDSSGLYDASTGRWALGSAVADTTRTIGAGLSYTYGNAGDDDRTTHDARLALSLALADGVAIGLTGRYMNYSGPASENGRLGVAYSGMTLDAGIAVRPWRFLSLGVTGISLTNPDTALSPRAVAGGFGIFPVENIGVVGDMYWDLRSYDSPRARYSGGLEVMLQHVPLRAGYAYDETRLGGPVHTFTAGLGYIDQSFGVEAALRQDVSGASQTTMLINLRYFMRQGQ